MGLLIKNKEGKMGQFRDLLNEASQRDVNAVKKVIKSLKFDFLVPEFFDVKLKETNAVLGSYPVVQVVFDKLSGTNKRNSDIKMVIDELNKKFKKVKQYDNGDYFTVVVDV